MRRSCRTWSPGRTSPWCTAGCARSSTASALPRSGGSSCCNCCRRGRDRWAWRREFERAVTRLDEISGYDLIVGADGVNSLVRRSHGEAFGASVSHLTNRFAWFGTGKSYATLTQTFRHTPIGDFNAHHYRYAPGRSTFIVEVDALTFARNGFDRMTDAEVATLCQKVFADALDGHPLISNNSLWRQFPLVHNARWSHGNCVLIGDALHTAHFSIGSGTRLAMEDAIALDRALAAHPATCRRRSPLTRRRGGRSWKSSSPAPTAARNGTSISPSTCGSSRPISP